MQSSWYLFPGQTPENTKISDRGKALVATRDAWTRLTSHLDAKQLQQEAVELERARRQAMVEGSQAMTKDWDNSIEKIRQRRLEALESRKQQKEEDKLQRFLQLRKEQEEERNVYVAEARKKMYMVQEKSRNLNSALLLSEVLYERRLQAAFEKLQLDRERADDAAYAQCVQVNAAREQEENSERRQRAKEQRAQYTKALEEQIKTVQDEAKAELDERIKWEQLDNSRADDEMKAIRAYEKSLERAKKADVKQQFHEFAELQKKHRAELQRQDEAEDKILDIYEKARRRIEQKRKQREKAVQAEKIRVREKIAAKVMAAAADYQEAEDRMLARAKEECDERERAKLEKEAAYQQQLRVQRAENRQLEEARTLKRIEQQAALQKWELLNRLKTDEMVQKYEQDKRQRGFDEKIAYRAELFEQMAEAQHGAEYEKKCKATELEYYRKKQHKEDREFFAYADEVLALAQSRGRTLEPIVKVVQQYKTDNELEPKQKTRTALESNVPINEKK